jgi:glycosyltransferase involved in cell wall biosynthesis
MMCFSVLMSVYAKENAEYLNKAIWSISQNQIFKPGQIVLVKDGALTPDLDAEIGRWEELLGDSLTVVGLVENVGLAGALNEGFRSCKYDLVARMDTDDISLPDRFEKQVTFMEKNSDISVCSGQIEEWSQNFSAKISDRKLPLHHDGILKFAKTRSPISHPAVILRKSAVLAVGGYPNVYPEDYQLWGTMISEGYKFANLPDTVLKMRVGNALVERRGTKFLKGIIKSYFHLYSIGLINRFELVSNIFLRSAVVLSPAWLKQVLYKRFR